MKKIWLPEYSVNVKEIDDQHKKLVELMGDLDIAIESGKVASELERILKELVDFSTYHFDTEEKYFEKFNYSRAEEHIKEHNDFKKKIQDFYRQYEHNEVKISKLLVEFLENWLVDHLVYQDRRYMKCFNDNGLC